MFQNRDSDDSGHTLIGERQRVGVGDEVHFRIRQHVDVEETLVAAIVACAEIDDDAIAGGFIEAASGIRPGNENRRQESIGPSSS